MLGLLSSGRVLQSLATCNQCVTPAGACVPLSGLSLCPDTSHNITLTWAPWHCDQEWPRVTSSCRWNPTWTGGEKRSVQVCLLLVFSRSWLCRRNLRSGIIIYAWALGQLRVSLSLCIVCSWPRLDHVSLVSQNLPWYVFFMIRVTSSAQTSKHLASLFFCSHDIIVWVWRSASPRDVIIIFHTMMSNIHL